MMITINADKTITQRNEQFLHESERIKGLCVLTKARGAWSPIAFLIR